MASLTKTYNNQKLLGQVYTPPFIVEKILDDIGFDQPTVLGKTILDPACGDGRFLEEIVRRLARFSQKKDLEKNLSCVHGWDIDAEAIALCRQNLDNAVAHLGISVHWNLKVCNSIEQLPADNSPAGSPHQDFDYIVGNPPYIRIQHLDEATRKYIQQNYHFCKSGSTDIYIAFYELCHQLLKKTGVCGLITPNTFFYTETGKYLREFMAHEKCLRQISNYADIQVFGNASTYSTIAVFDKQKNERFLFQQASDKTVFSSRWIEAAEIKGQKFWQLSTTLPTEGGKTKLKDICKIHVGVTTLCDKAYIFTIEDMDEHYIWANTRLRQKVKLERGIIKPIVKGSTLKTGTDSITEYILFPYQKNKGKNQIIPEATLQAEYPFAYQYLLSVKEELDQRDNGKKNTVAWYAFGRSQGLDTSFGKKIIFSPMNKKPNFVLHENEDCTFYSGYCIKYGGDYGYLLRELNSQRLADFIAVSCRDFRGGWKAYNKKTLEEFTVSQAAE